jgi:hypothetical protein
MLLWPCSLPTPLWPRLSHSRISAATRVRSRATLPRARRTTEGERGGPWSLSADVAEWCERRGGGVTASTNTILRSPTAGTSTIHDHRRMMAARCLTEYPTRPNNDIDEPLVDGILRTRRRRDLGLAGAAILLAGHDEARLDLRDGNHEWISVVLGLAEPIARTALRSRPSWRRSLCRAGDVGGDGDQRSAMVAVASRMEARGEGAGAKPSECHEIRIIARCRPARRSMR